MANDVAPVDLATVATALERLCPGGVRLNEPLARHVSFRIGGPADILVLPNALDSLDAAVAWLYAEGVPFVVLGRGSNVLIADRGIRGVVLKTGRGQEHVTYDGPCLHAECGVSLPHLSRRTAERGLAGLEFAAGIPGSVGGAVVMNAGAHGCAMADVLISVRARTPGGLVTWAAADLEMRYRHSRVQDQPGVVLDCEMRLRPAPAAETVARLEAWLETRAESQPLGPPSSGCIFRNPDDDYAGRLIDVAGIKRLRVGGAVVSDRHANYILNTGGATARDVLALIAQVQALVHDRAGRDLTTEIKMLGDFGTA
ncbi:MAG TPA: UDP-N-acetylmuramate dehydrogenase [bacterium]|nr:UDP-N-acetylmuramate dehydrogenase [bacterium]